MARYNWTELKQDSLFEVAKLCALAVQKAPQLTARSEIKMEILTGEDLQYLIDALMVLGRLEQFNMLSYLCWKNLYDEGRPPVLLLIGGNVRMSELNWNCAACGFSTCAEFNSYSKKIKPLPRYMIQGPTCHWKLLDYAIACDWACASAWQNNVTNRIEIASGMAAASLGYLDSCDVIMGLPLGPTEDMYWYNRTVLNYLLPHDLWLNRIMSDFPFHFATFPGNGRMEIKGSDRWWEEFNIRKIEKRPIEELKKLRDEVTEELEKIKQRRLEAEAKK